MLSLGSAGLPRISSSDRQIGSHRDIPELKLARSRTCLKTGADLGISDLKDASCHDEEIQTTQIRLVWAEVRINTWIFAKVPQIVTSCDLLVCIVTIRGYFSDL